MDWGWVNWHKFLSQASMANLNKTIKSPVFFISFLFQTFEGNGVQCDIFWFNQSITNWMTEPESLSSLPTCGLFYVNEQDPFLSSQLKLQSPPSSPDSFKILPCPKWISIERKQIILRWQPTRIQVEKAGFFQIHLVKTVCYSILCH